MSAHTKPAHCAVCPGASWEGYQAAADGSPSLGVLLLGEALGQQEAVEGLPFKGPAGFMLAQLLQRIGLRREQVLIDNCVRCRPPHNLLAGLSDEGVVIRHCTEHHLAETVRLHRPRVVVALGTIPARHMLALEEWDEETIGDLRGYVAWSPQYECWVVPTYHPAFLLRGQSHLAGVVLADIQRALRLVESKEPFALRPLELEQALVDPTPPDFDVWVAELEAACAANPLDPPAVAYDIETPYKVAARKKEEEDESAAFEDETYEILRIGLSWGPGRRTCTIPWAQPYLPALRRVFATGNYIVWNGAYDTPRLLAAGLELQGRILDAMEGWHLLNSALPKRLAFVTPFYLPQQPRWKQLSDRAPALYNALDAQVTWEVAQGIWRDLQSQGTWPLFLRHMVELRTILDTMERRGVPVDGEHRQQVAQDLAVQQARLVEQLQEVVPREVRPLHIYKRPVEERTGPEWETIEGTLEHKRCSRCGEWGVTLSHVHRRFLKGTKTPNPCHEAEVRLEPHRVQLDARRLPFVPSNKMLQDYLQLRGHRPVLAEKTKRVTFDDEALEVLMRRYPGDAVYPLVRQYREVEKIASTYIGSFTDGVWKGGMPTGADGRIHTHYTNNPATLRLSSVAPNLQNIPRGSGGGDAASLVKEIFVADPGTVMVEVDYRAIEAVLVGYLAGDPLYVRMSRLGIHDFLNSHILAERHLIAQPADPSWSDADLRAFFGDLRKRFPAERNAAKRVCHSSNYGATPARLMQADKVSFPSTKVAQGLQALYFNVFPKVRQWQERTVLQAAKQGYLRTPFGNVMRFWRPVEYRRAGRTWVAEWGEEAKAALAFAPQSTAAGIMKEALLRVGAIPRLLEALRLTIHDSLVLMLDERAWEADLASVQQLMEQPHAALPLEATWGMGSFLGIDTEAKAGWRWSALDNPSRLPSRPA